MPGSCPIWRTVVCWFPPSGGVEEPIVTLVIGGVGGTGEMGLVFCDDKNLCRLKPAAGTDFRRIFTAGGDPWTMCASGNELSGGDLSGVDLYEMVILPCFIYF